MNDLTRVSAKEFVRNFEPLSDKALAEPVAITRDGRDRLILMSVEEYARLKRRDRGVHDAAELRDDVLDAIERSEMDARHAPLDTLVADWTP